MRAQLTFRGGELKFTDANDTRLIYASPLLGHPANVGGPPAKTILMVEIIPQRVRIDWSGRSIVKSKGSSWIRRLFWTVVLLAGLGAGGWYGYMNRERLFAEPVPQFQSATVARGELVQGVTASGQLNPVIKVQVGSQISGNIQKLFADFNSPVKEGQVIAQLDPSTYQAYVLQAEGILASAKAALELAQANFDRAKALRKESFATQADYDKALVELHQAEAAVKTNEGNLAKAKVDLARCTIVAPIDGVVISRNVDVGQTVAASLSAPTLFVIAGDLAKMQIEANVAEADIGSVEVGQDVDFTVDAFLGQAFHGKVAQIRYAPTVDQNVVTYATIIAVTNPNLKLMPGMTANVSIIFARHDNALKIPNAALRFRPPAAADEKKSRATASAADAGAKSAQKSGGGHKKDKRKAERTVYVLAPDIQSTNEVKSSVLLPRQIKTGINDGSFTEVLEGLQAGDEIVTGLVPAKENFTSIASIFSSNKKKR
jgi:HlyD family secretion protein